MRVRNDDKGGYVDRQSLPDDSTQWQSTKASNLILISR